MSRDFALSLMTTVFSLLVIVIFSFTAVLN
ncbi:MAG: YnhF family membrane protein [Sodalis sp. (in: enterobacteria)]|uniref:YnhF family membrane protein n=1 Tax=Sodalis glossinidius (strain morsitans) TaxID=343509 RepID=A0A193QJY4_SODGM|nr:YnhF family membrane protein [Sodalis glossinidius]CRL45492.1 hypothetical protein SGGMMB4_03258 [Sodalis glossinidius str. 'morsitans']